ncbi:N-acetyltransferase family protein [Sporofaciens sp. SGI.106]|uniref:GNAT family N-acetyltransferase n=1 Tax=Sporofaciens sp. SGI.106 TaxID=3420568 RepID=UPI002A9EA2B2|nr:GNAT family N-acetyltransferase [Lachnoclostridium sp.]
MIRKAVFDDIDRIEDTYNEHFEYEIEHEAFTVFKKGVYPTREDAEKAVNTGSLYIYEENSNIAGSMILDKVQPIEYSDIQWRKNCRKDEVMVIHLLMVRPAMSGKGIASSLIKYAVELAECNHCKVLRLDTGSQNIPAISLYKKAGFEIVATASKKVGDRIAHGNHLFLEKML